MNNTKNKNKLINKNVNIIRGRKLDKYELHTAYILNTLRNIIIVTKYQSQECNSRYLNAQYTTPKLVSYH